MKNQDAYNLINIELSNIRYCIDLINPIIETVNKFNDKVFNIKLDKALKEIDKNLSAVVRYDNLEIKYYKENRSCKSEISSCWVYTKDSSLHLLWGMTLNKNEFMNDAAITVLNENSRIISKNIVYELENTKKRLIEMEKEINFSLINIDLLHDKKEQLEKEINEHNNGVNWIVNEYFDLKIKTVY